MDFERLEIEGPVLVKPSRIGDGRGWFSEVLRLNALTEAVGPVAFVQHNHSFSQAQGTLRGLHFQSDPKAQGKLIKCIRGKILDVAVDIRKSSKSFGQHVWKELTAQNGHELWIPQGFAHGFVTLEENTEVLYFATDYYSSQHEHGILWNDPELGIDWGISEEAAILSEKDSNWPPLRNLDENALGRRGQ